MPKIAGHNITDKQLVALHGLYRGLLKDNRTVYGVNVARQLAELAADGIITGTGLGAYMIPWGSPGDQIIGADPDFVISAHL